MDNKIIEKYFSQEDFSKQKQKALSEVVRETGFKVEKEIFRGVIYEKEKVGSIIYKGVFKGKPAVLKLQGLRPETDEGEIIRRFIKQNKSKLVRVPLVYDHKPWNKKRGYGYLITEYVDGHKIFTMPFASPTEMQNFASFYQEYRTSALTRPWSKPETKDGLAFTMQRVKHWQKICESKKRLAPSDYAPYLAKYFSLAEKHLPSIPMVFCHAHLTADDIYCVPNGSYVLLSNLFWGYRLQWHDLAFNLWACLQHIRDTHYTLRQWVQYSEQWLATYRAIPIVQKDKKFERKITILFLERVMGGILVDVGVNETLETKENKPYFRHLLELHQHIFNYLTDKIKML